MRKRLIELLKPGYCRGEDCDRCMVRKVAGCRTHETADFLIENGVVVGPDARLTAENGKVRIEG